MSGEPNTLTITVSVPDALKEAVDGRVSSGASGSAGEFICQAIREKLQRDLQHQEAGAALTGKLLTALNSGKAAPLTDEGLMRLARRYVDQARGDNDDNPKTNGELKVLAACVPLARVVFDCGANVGNWTRLALSVNPNLEIHCFEPLAENFDKLKTLESTGKVICNPFGLGEADEDRKLYRFEVSGELSSLFVRPALCANGQPPRAEMVKIRTLDGYLANTALDRIDFFKVDVEGNELAVFRGAAGAFASGRIAIAQFEYGGTYIDSRTLLNDIFDFLEPHPYDLFKITSWGIRRVPKYEPWMENFAYQNWLVVHRDSAATKVPASLYIS